jgi:hypothetical protein
MTRPSAAPRGLWLLSALVLATGVFYFWTAAPERPLAGISPVGNGYYNLLMRGFLKGRLSLDLPADPYLASIPNASDPVQRGEHGLHDASYFKGSYYLYFGAAPVFLIFLPFFWLTGLNLDETLAPPAFALLGLAASVILVMAVRRRYFPRSPRWVAACCVAALGLADMMPILLRRSNVWEVAITCAYACAMVGLLAAFQSLHSGRRVAWLAVASAAFGLAVASRPTYLFGCGALLVPIAALAADRRSRRAGTAGLTATRLALAGLGPIAGIGVLLALYNVGRFGSPLDFGFRHLMNGEQVWKEDLYSPRFFLFNLRVYALAPARWGPYFPFVSVAHLPPAPPGHLGSEDPYGVIPNIPFALLAVAALALCARARAWPGGMRLTVLAVALVTAGTGLATTAFGGAINRYEVDFVPGVIVLACFGWLALASGPARGLRSLVSGLAAAALAYSVVFNVLASFRHNELFAAEHAALYRRVAHAWDWVPEKADEWLGTRYGPVELRVVFPEARTGASEPLVATGCSFLSDYLSVHYDAPGRVSFGLQHSAYGNFTGPSVPASPGAVHTIKVEMGSLYPPPGHPYFDKLGAAASELCQKTLRVTLDGNLALRRDMLFFDAVSREPSIGTADGRELFAEPFSGRILSWRRLPVDLTAPERGPVHLTVTFPPFTGIRSEPLVSTGANSRGDLVYVRYEGPASVSFGVDHWGYGSALSSPLPVDFAQEHAIDVSFGALDGSPQPVGTEDSGRLVLEMDGRTIFWEKAPFASCDPETVTAGVNRLGSSAAGAMFRGQMLERRGSLPGGRVDPNEQYGALEMGFRMPADALRAQPLVTTGRTGVGDALSIRWVGPGRVRLGYDDWGSSFLESADIALVPGEDHVMRISMPSLLGAAVTPGEALSRDALVVSIDGAPVWVTKVVSHRAEPAQAYVGSNGIGASTCAQDFKGAISWFERHPAVPAASEGAGRVARGAHGEASRGEDGVSRAAPCEGHERARRRGDRGVPGPGAHRLRPRPLGGRLRAEQAGARRLLQGSRHRDRAPESGRGALGLRHRGDRYHPGRRSRGLEGRAEILRERCRTGACRKQHRGKHLRARLHGDDPVGLRTLGRFPKCPQPAAPAAVKQNGSRHDREHSYENNAIAFAKGPRPRAGGPDPPGDLGPRRADLAPEGAPHGRRRGDLA